MDEKAPVIVLTGIKETLRDLKQFDQDAVRKFNRVLNKALIKTERDAKQIVADVGDSPMRGWREGPPKKPRGGVRGGKGWPGWYDGEVQAGIKKSKAQGKVRKDKGYTTSAGALLNTSAAGAIFEIAGRKSKGRGNGQQFVRNLGNRFKKASRLVWRVVDEDREKIQAAVLAALNEAKAELQKHLDRETGKWSN